MTEELFSGWAPDAPIDDSLLRQFTFACADRGAFLAGRLDRRQLRTESVAAVDLDSPVLFDNLAVLLAPPGMIDLEATVASVIDFYPPDRPFVLASAWHTGDLSHHGIRLMGHPPFMVRPPGGEAPALPGGFRIDEVHDAGGIDTFVRTIVAAYPMPGAEQSVFDPRMLGGPVRLFVGYEGDRPVATSGVVVEHGVADVEWVSTMADTRGKGYGEAITWAATLAAPSVPAVLIASDDGVGVYRRMGFHPLLRFTLWFRGDL